MIRAVESYLAVRRAAGHKLRNAGFMLYSFARYAVKAWRTALSYSDGDRVGKSRLNARGARPALEKRVPPCPIYAGGR